MEVCGSNPGMEIYKNLQVNHMYLQTLRNYSHHLESHKKHTSDDTC